MKKVSIIALFCVIEVVCLAQNSGFYYQGIAKTKEGVPLTSQTISVYISILSASPEKLFYKENHSVKTDEAGRFTFIVGEGTALQGHFNDIDWSLKESWLQTEIDAGVGIEDMGKSRILAVPVANYAKTASKVEFDYVIGLMTTGQNGSFVMAQGTSNSSQYVYTNTYMYDYEPVEFSIDEVPVGLAVSPEKFIVNQENTSSKQFLTMTADKTLNIGDYTISMTAKSNSGKVRKNGFVVKVIEDSISKYVGGKYKVVDVYEINGVKKETTYTEKIILVDHQTIKFSANFALNGHSLLYNVPAQIDNKPHWNQAWIIPQFSNPSQSNPYYSMIGGTIVNNLTSFKEFVMELNVGYFSSSSYVTENHKLTFTRIE